MNEEIKKRWIEALTDGSYEQGYQTLHKGNQFCCLGVLCDLHAKEFGIEWKELSTGNHSYLTASSALPVSVKDWAGLDSHDPVVNVIGNTLAYLNDHGATFAVIAEIIEAKL